MAGKTLEERCYILKKQFPYRKISPTSLRRIYRKHWIKKKAVLIKKVGTAKKMAEI